MFPFPSRVCRISRRNFQRVRWSCKRHGFRHVVWNHMDSLTGKWKTSLLTPCWVRKGSKTTSINKTGFNTWSPCSSYDTASTLALPSLVSGRLGLRITTVSRVNRPENQPEQDWIFGQSKWTEDLPRGCIPGHYGNYRRSTRRHLKLLKQSQE